MAAKKHTGGTYSLNKNAGNFGTGKGHSMMPGMSTTITKKRGTTTTRGKMAAHYKHQKNTGM